MSGRQICPPMAISEEDPSDGDKLLCYAAGMASIVHRHTGLSVDHVVECIMRLLGHLCEIGAARNGR